MARDVEISIIDHENRDIVRRCLQSLPDACTGLEWHATVIDNVSEDGSREMLASEFPHVEVLVNTRRLGFGANHNQVLRRVVTGETARSVLVLNDDTELDPLSVTRLVAALDRDERLGAVAPTVVGPHGGVRQGRFAYPSIRDAFAPLGDQRPDPEGWLQGACLLVRTSAVAVIGGYDERFFLFYEDCDLSKRLIEAGWDLGECPEARVMHLGHQTVLKPEMAAFSMKQGIRSRYLYLQKHEGDVVAGVTAVLTRIAMGGRGLRARVAKRADASTLLTLARYDPRRPLEPEVASRLP